MTTMERKSSDVVAHAVAFATVAVWGSTFVSTKVLIANGLSPAQIFTVRFAMAYVLMLAVSHKRLFASSLRDEAVMFLLGVTGGSAYFLTENYALEHSTATNVSLIVCSCPLFTMLLFRLFDGGVRLSRWQVAGSGAAFVGMAAVVLNGRFVLQLSPIGDSLAFAACLCWAFYSLLIKRVSGRYSAAFVTRKVFFYGLATVLPYYLLFPEWPSPGVFARPEVAFNLLFLGCVASMVCFLAWTWVISRIGAMTATNYVYVNPLATIVFACWILGERITLWFVLGAALILSGLYLNNKSTR